MTSDGVQPPIDELPEWFQMLKQLFSDLNVFSSDYYDDMNCEGILNQARFAALRDKKNFGLQEVGTCDAEKYHNEFAESGHNFCYNCGKQLRSLSQRKNEVDDIETILKVVEELNGSIPDFPEKMMSLQEKVIKELGFGMNMPNEPDVAFVAIWLSRKQDGHLSPSFCAMYEEPVPEEIKAKMADVLKYYAERILESDPPIIRPNQLDTGEGWGPFGNRPLGQ